MIENRENLGESKPREILGARLIFFTLANLGLMLPNVMAGVFGFQYYCYTLNIDSSAVLTVSFIQLFLSAISSIFAGVIIDNKKPGKRGKRRLFLLYGLPFWIISHILIWFPPLTPQQFTDPVNPVFFMPTIIYYATISFVRSIAGSFILSAHLSIFPDVSQTPKNREKVSRYKTIFVITSSVIGMAAPMIVQFFLEEPEKAFWWTPSGKLIRLIMPLLGIAFTSFGAISVILAYFALSHEKDIYTSVPYREMLAQGLIEKISLKKSILQIVKPLKDIEFVKFLFMAFFSSIAGSILGKSINPFLLYVIRPSLPEEIKGIELLLYPIISVIFKFLWLWIWITFFGKIRLTQKYSWNYITLIGFSLFMLIFLVEIFIPVIFSYIWIIIFFVISVGSILGGMYSRRYFQIPYLASLIDEAQIKRNNGEKFNNSSISGSFYGSNSFVMNMGSAVANLIVGFSLTGNNRSNPIILTLLFASMGILYLIAWLFLKKIKLRKEI